MRTTEQMPLGNAAYDSLNVSITWRLETGWRLRCSGRRSGSTVWEQSFADEDQAFTTVMVKVLEDRLRAHGTRDQDYEEPF